MSYLSITPLLSVEAVHVRSTRVALGALAIRFPGAVGASPSDEGVVTSAVLLGSEVLFDGSRAFTT